jgi:hypothetical protein
VAEVTAQLIKHLAPSEGDFGKVAALFSSTAPPAWDLLFSTAEPDRAAYALSLAATLIVDVSDAEIAGMRKEPGMEEAKLWKVRFIQSGGLTLALNVRWMRRGSIDAEGYREQVERGGDEAICYSAREHHLAVLDREHEGKQVATNGAEAARQRSQGRRTKGGSES